MWKSIVKRGSREWTEDFKWKSSIRNWAEKQWVTALAELANLLQKVGRVHSWCVPGRASFWRLVLARHSECDSGKCECQSVSEWGKWCKWWKMWKWWMQWERVQKAEGASVAADGGCDRGTGSAARVRHLRRLAEALARVARVARVDGRALLQPLRTNCFAAGSVALGRAGEGPAFH